MHTARIEIGVQFNNKNKIALRIAQAAYASVGLVRLNTRSPGMNQFTRTKGHSCELTMDVKV